MCVLHHQTLMSTTTINRIELTDAQRREFQALLERNCQSIFDDAGVFSCVLYLRI